jgi:twitching motility protein PilU
MELDQLLGRMKEVNASDLFLKPFAEPAYKISGRITPAGGDVITIEQMEECVRVTLRPKDQETFLTRNQVDFSYSIHGVGRFRGNCYRQRGTVAMVFRRINTEVPTAEQLGLPDTLKNLSMERRGMVLVTGATGSGKSTTLAAMIDWRNDNTQGHIVTIEDPIEFLHRDKSSIISQREVGVDVDNFHDALKAAMRQAPDVLLMGEIRDAEGMETALHLSETGHLVMGTLHSTNANQTVERILQFFNPDRHTEILALLAFNLRGIASQRLIRGLDGRPHLALEVLVGTPRIRELLKRGEIGELKSAIGQGDRDGMITFDQSIYNLYESGRIDQESALIMADSPNDLRLKMRGFVALGR